MIPVKTIDQMQEEARQEVEAFRGTSEWLALRYGIEPTYALENYKATAKGFGWTGDPLKDREEIETYLKRYERSYNNVSNTAQSKPQDVLLRIDQGLSTLAGAAEVFFKADKPLGLTPLEERRKLKQSLRKPDGTYNVIDLLAFAEGSVKVNIPDFGEKLKDTFGFRMARELEASRETLRQDYPIDKAFAESIVGKGLAAVAEIPVQMAVGRTGPLAPVLLGSDVFQNTLDDYLQTKGVTLATASEDQIVEGLTFATSNLGPALLLEKLGLDGLTKGLFKGSVKLSGRALRTALAGVAEGATEYGQTLIQDVLAKMQFDPDREINLLDWETFLIGTVAGTAVRAPLEGVDAVAQRVRDRLTLPDGSPPTPSELKARAATLTFDEVNSLSDTAKKAIGGDAAAYAEIFPTDEELEARKTEEQRQAEIDRVQMSLDGKPDDLALQFKEASKNSAKPLSNEEAVAASILFKETFADSELANVRVEEGITKADIPLKVKAEPDNTAVQTELEAYANAVPKAAEVLPSLDVAEASEALASAETPQGFKQRFTASGFTALEQDIPIADIVINKDVPQFKADADPKTGVVEGNQLQGSFDEVAAQRIIVWEKLNGEKEVITGRHRLELATRSGRKDIAAYVFRESDGFTQADAMVLDAEYNIKDGQGKVKDYANYFKRAGITKEEAESRGLLSRDKGRSGWALGQEAVPSVYDLYANGKLSEAKAVAIASGAPQNEGAQQAALRKAKDMSAEELRFYAQTVSGYQGSSERGLKQGTLFDDDDPVLIEAEAIAKAASSLSHSNQERIRAVQGAVKRPELAREMGLDISNPDEIKNEVERLQAENEALKKQPSGPLMEKLREMAGLPPANAFSLEAQTPEQLAAEAASRDAAQRQRDGIEQGLDAPLTGDSSDVGQGRLFAEDTDLFSGPALDAASQLPAEVVSETATATEPFSRPQENGVKTQAEHTAEVFAAVQDRLRKGGRVTIYGIRPIVISDPKTITLKKDRIYINNGKSGGQIGFEDVRSLAAQVGKPIKLENVYYPEAEETGPSDPFTEAEIEAATSAPVVNTAAGAKAIAKKAAEIERDNTERIKSVKNAVLRPKQAAEMGLDVTNPESIKYEIARLQAENEALRSPSGEVLARLRNAAKGEETAIPAVGKSFIKGDTSTEPVLSAQDVQDGSFNLASESLPDAERELKEQLERESAQMLAESQQQTLFQRAWNEAAKKAKPSHYESIDAFREYWNAKGVMTYTSILGKERPWEHIRPFEIEVKKENRGKGLGTAYMNDLIAFADSEGKQVRLNVSAKLGATSVNRLKRFYKRFGFVENKPGKNKDYSISESFYRNPSQIKSADADYIEAVKRGDRELKEQLEREAAQMLAEGQQQTLFQRAWNDATNDTAVTPKQDADYIEAVKRGDMASAQKMVNEAAKKAGYDSPKVYHGTQANFVAFDSSRIGKTNGMSEGPGFYFTTDQSVADGYQRGEGHLISAYLKITKLLDYYAKPFSLLQIKKLLKEVALTEARDSLAGEWKDGFLSNFGNTYSQSIDSAVSEAAKYFMGEAYAKDQIGGIIGSGVAKDIVNKALTSSLGYDTYFANGYSGAGEAGGDIYVATNPNQIKSADAVTYDDAGNVIPLSERFNEASDDIRFQLGDTPDHAKGSITFEADGAAVIKIFKQGDVSTVIHEFLHLAEQKLLLTDTEVEGITESQKAAYKAFTGYDKATTAKEITDAREKGARAFERYMRQGKAPNDALKPLFQRISEWMAGIYQRIKGSAIDVKLTPEIREVFDAIVTRQQRLRQQKTADLDTLEGVAKLEALVAQKAEPETLFQSFREELKKLAEREEARQKRKAKATKGVRAETLEELGEELSLRQRVKLVGTLQDMIAMLPRPVRGDLIRSFRRLAELKTLKGQKRYLEGRQKRVNAVLEAYLQQQYRNEIMEDAAKVKTQIAEARAGKRKLRYESKDVEAYLNTFVMSTRPEVADTEAKAQALQDKAELTLEESIALSGYLAELNRPNIFDRTIPSGVLKKIGDELQQFIKDGTIKRLEKLANKAEATRNNAQAIAIEIKEHHGAEKVLSPATVKVDDGKKLHPYDLLRPRTLMTLLTGKKKSTLHEHVLKPMSLAENRKTVGLEAAKETFQRVFGNLPLESSWVQSVLGKEGKAGAIASQTLTTIQGQKITYNTAMFMYAHSQNARSRAHLNATVMGNLRLNDAVYENVFSVLPQPYKDAVDAILDWHDEVQYPRLAEVFYEQTGAVLPKESRYMPIRALDRNTGYEELLKDYYDAGISLRKGMTVARTDSVIGFQKMDFYGDVVRNTKNTEHYIAYADTLQSVSGILQNKDLAKVMEKADAKAKTLLTQWLGDVARGRFGKSAEDDIDKAVDQLRRNASVALLGFNLITALKQPASLFPAIKQGDGGSILHTLAEMANPAKALAYIQFARESSPFMRGRSGRLLSELAEQEQVAEVRGLIGRGSAWQKFRDMAYTPMRVVDAFTTTVVWQGQYRSAINEGKTHEDAVYEADALVAQTQSTGDLLHSARLYRQNGFKKALLTFTNDINQAMNVTVEDAATLKYEDNKALAVAASIVLTYLLPAFLLSAVGFVGREAYQAIGLAEEDDEDVEDIPAKFAGEFMGQVFGGIPIFGGAPQALALGVFGNEQSQYYRATDAAPYMIAVEAAAKGDVTDAVGFGLGIPAYLQWKKIVEALLED